MKKTLGAGTFQHSTITLLIGLAFFSLACAFPHGAAAEIGKTPDFIGEIVTDEEDLPFIYTTGVYADPVNSEIYMLDGRGRIIIYTPDLFPLFTISEKNGVELAQSVAVDRQGYLYVVHTVRDTGQARISVFSPRLKRERDIEVPAFPGAETFKPYRVDVDNRGNLYIAGYYDPNVLVLDVKTGTLKGVIRPSDESTKEIKINSVDIDRDGRIYLLSEEESAIFVYDTDRKFLFRFGEKGGSSGKLSRAQAVGIDDDKGLIIVPDFMRHTILVHRRSDGKFLFEFGGLGWGPGWFQHPRDLTVDRTGRIIIADTFNNRIQVLELKETAVK